MSAATRISFIAVEAEGWSRRWLAMSVGLCTGSLTRYFPLRSTSSINPQRNCIPRPATGSSPTNPEIFNPRTVASTGLGSPMFPNICLNLEAILVVCGYE